MVEIRIELTVELPFWIRLNFQLTTFFLDIETEQLEFALANDVWELYTAERETLYSLHFRIPEFYYVQPEVQEILYNQDRFKFSKRKTNTIISQAFKFSENFDKSDRTRLERYMFDKIQELRKRFFNNVNLFIGYYKEQFCPERPNSQPGAEIEELTWFMFMSKVEHQIHIDNELLFLRVNKPEDIGANYPFHIIRESEVGRFKMRLTNRPRLNYKNYLWKNAISHYDSNNYFLVSTFCKAAAEAYFKEFLKALRFIKLLFLQRDVKETLSKTFIEDGFSNHFDKIKDYLRTKITENDFKDFKYVTDIRNQYLHRQRRKDPDLSRFRRGMLAASNVFSVISEYLKEPFVSRDIFERLIIGLSTSAAQGGNVVSILPFESATKMDEIARLPDNEREEFMRQKIRQIEEAYQDFMNQILIPLNNGINIINQRRQGQT